MAHYRLSDRMPSAIVTVDGSEKKIYEGNTIYLNKGDNFEFRFFNPLQEKIGVEIIFNGQKKNDGYLVLNPGQDISLDRFLDDKRKMSFDAYYINANDPSAVEAAALNGLVDINFYKENYGYTPFGGSGLPHFKSTSRTYSSSGFRSPGVYTTHVDHTWSPVTESTTTSGGNITLDNLSETGRVEKGEVSNQNLNEVNMDFDPTPFHSIHYQLKPTSTRGYTTATEIRNYCPQCGYRLRKSSWRFCPKCGEKLI